MQVDLRVARRPARSLREREGKRGDDEPGRHGPVAGGSAHGRCRVQLRARDHGRCAATVLRRARAAGPWPGFWPALLAIVAAGVAIRVVYTLVEAPWPPPGLDDQFYFSALPKLLADGHGFIAPFKLVFDHVSVATAEHPPLYSVVLAGPGAARAGLARRPAPGRVGVRRGARSWRVGLLGRRLAGDRAGLIAAGIGGGLPDAWSPRTAR